MPIGGCVMASGVKFEAVWLADFWQIRIHAFQANFERHLDDLLPVLRQQGFGCEEEVEAELMLSEAGMQVFFPKYRVLAKVTLIDGTRLPALANL